jgi:hypothetical protein
MHPQKRKVWLFALIYNCTKEKEKAIQLLGLLHLDAMF